MLFVGRVLAGISGASFGTAAAYIADVSDDSEPDEEFRADRHRHRHWFRVRSRSSAVFSANSVHEFPSMALLPCPSSISSSPVPPARNAGPPQPAPFRMVARQSAGHAEADAQLSRHRLDWSCLLPLLAGARGLPRCLVVRRVLPLRLERGADRTVARHLRCQRRACHGRRPATVVSRFGEWRTALLGLVFSALGLVGYRCRLGGVDGLCRHRRDRLEASSSRRCAVSRRPTCRRRRKVSCRARSRASSASRQSSGR